LIRDFLRRYGGLALALAITAGVLAVRQSRERVDYTHAQLPNFDSYVYVAMAENPAYFTVSPWGYRLLHPWIVGTQPARAMVRSFRDLALLSLLLCGGLLYAFLRRLGHGEAASLLGVLAYAASDPVLEAVRVPFLGEPAALLTQMAFVVALESGAGLPVLAFLLAAGSYAKESTFFLVPLVFLARRRAIGTARALRAAALAALPAAAIVLALHYHWTPWVSVPRPALDGALAAAALKVLGETWAETAQALLLGGLLPLALLGALRRPARPYLARYGYLACLLLAVSVTAWWNVPASQAVPLFSVNTRRILIYALPFLVPLALIALDKVFGRFVPALAPGTAVANAPPRRWPNVLAGAAAGALVLVPFVELDRYRRAPLHESRDGPLVRVTCAESLRVARHLSRGESVSFDPAVQKFAWGVYPAEEASRMRWFLRMGWGRLAHYGTGDAVMHDPLAGLLVPCLVPRDMDVALTLEAPSRRLLQAFVNGLPAGTLTAGPGSVEGAVRLPRQHLFRGDNLLTLAAEPGEGRVTLRRLTYRPVR
jgi:hypothetical protein